jgi:hypothetical protein
MGRFDTGAGRTTIIAPIRKGRAQKLWQHDGDPKER